MSGRAQHLAHRRESLRLRAAAQRAELAYDIGIIQQRLGRIDQVVNTVRRIGRKPFLIGAAAAVLALVGPGRLMRWGTRGFLAVNTARTLLKQFSRQAPTNCRLLNSRRALA